MSRKTRTRLYIAWRNMKSRCYNPSHKSFPLYGGRGITVCELWRISYAAFEEWALANGYEQNLTLDRFPNKSGNYEPSNCRWATWQEQERNRENNIPPITAFGETKRIWDWLSDDRCKVSRNVLLLRIETGRDPEWAMTASAHEQRRRKPHSSATRKLMSERAQERERRKRNGQ